MQVTLSAPLDPPPEESLNGNRSMGGRGCERRCFLFWGSLPELGPHRARRQPGSEPLVSHARRALPAPLEGSTALRGAPGLPLPRMEQTHRPDALQALLQLGLRFPVPQDFLQPIDQFCSKLLRFDVDILWHSVGTLRGKTHTQRGTRLFSPSPLQVSPSPAHKAPAATTGENSGPEASKGRSLAPFQNTWQEPNWSPHFFKVILLKLVTTLGKLITTEGHCHLNLGRL